MTDFARLLAADRNEPATPITLVPADGVDAFIQSLGETGRAAAAAADFRGKAGSSLFVPGGKAGEWSVAVGLGEAQQAGRWTLAAAAAAVPAGHYRVDTPLEPVALHGWLMAQHRFDRYRQPADARGERVLLVPNPAAIDQALAEADAAALVRDLVDTPAEDLGPAELEAAVRRVAEPFGATVAAIIGDHLLEDGFPAIHAVGRASPRRPRLIRLDWGDPRHPLLALVGKGVCFDTGGLNLKPGAGMALMKKDMGGAAHALALARLVMARRLPVRLLLLIPAVDNAVDGISLRPGDVIRTRKGLSVEVGNTDAEGRLVLADALTLAQEAQPALLLDFATLTGAARVALGPELPALFCNDDALAAQWQAAATASDDPLWRLPLWRNYRRMFRSTIADLNNNAEGGFAGAIVAALFLEHFVADGMPWAHLDLYAWNGEALPGRPKGGAAMGLMAAFHLLEQRFG